AEPERDPLPGGNHGCRVYPAARAGAASRRLLATTAVRKFVPRSKEQEKPLKETMSDALEPRAEASRLITSSRSAGSGWARNECLSLDVRFWEPRAEARGSTAATRLRRADPMF